MEKIPVGILGATGMVGQWFVKLLAHHPWFEVTALAASARSAGKTYAEATTWVIPGEPPEAVQGMVIEACDPHLPCRLVFSALPGAEAGPIEEAFAAAGYVVSSNASSHRYDPDVPLLIPEVNPDHLGLIEVQRRRRRWQGFIVTCANCSTTQLVLALEPLRRAFGIRAISVVTMQALSGAGYPGVPGLSILGNVIPYIPGEEEKLEREPKKIWGVLQGEEIAEAELAISAHCHRVATRDGHLEAVSVALEREAALEEVIAALEDFRSLPQELELPSAPARPIVVRKEPDRPQPRRDREEGGGMSVVVGRVRACPVLDWKLELLGHNTVRGAAGGAILNAELLLAQGYLG
ncbi:TPA: aspartate-semialdehyde dehydrogenase [Candidatus Bipolaricaulota bacterium]|nr:aspartate-semialdehyde dehydrogenase [Candidatus Bipolaricaulota bacterium]